jgi:hypothetical protein
MQVSALQRTTSQQLQAFTRYLSVLADQQLHNAGMPSRPSEDACVCYYQLIPTIRRVFMQGKHSISVTNSHFIRCASTNLLQSLD